MKKTGRAILGILLLLISVQACWASASDYEKMVVPRTAVSWIEGQSLGDMVLGSRASVTFVYVDSKFGSFLRKNNGEAPEWLQWHAQEYGSHKGKALFAIQIETFKPWNFAVEELTIAGYQLTSADVLTKEEYRPFGELPSKFKGEFSVVIPAKLLQRGKEISLSYGDYRTTLLVPK